MSFQPTKEDKLILLQKLVLFYQKEVVTNDEVRAFVKAKRTLRGKISSFLIFSMRKFLVLPILRNLQQ